MEKKKKAKAEFFYLSDTVASAVEDLISQTKGLPVLEQIAAINGSSFTTDDSLLPPDLEFPLPQAEILPSPQTPNHAAEFEQSQDEVAPMKGGCFWCSPKKPDTVARATKKGISMSFKWTEEDEGIVGFGRFSPIKSRRSR